MGKQEVEAILLLEDSLKAHKKHTQQLEDQLAKDSAQGGDVVEVGMQLRDARATFTRLTDSIRRKRANLGVDQRSALRKLKDNTFLQIRMNARAIKIRIRDRLRQRKFELERLERSYRHAVNGKFRLSVFNRDLNDYPEHKLTGHADTSIKHREPGIAKLTKTYNDYCKELQSLAKQHQAPRKAFIPKPIDPQKIFALDVDDDIWQDVGLDGEEDKAVPLWLGNDDVRKGIKHLLMLDRCLEEECRLKRERVAMQSWMNEEWEILQKAINANGVCVETHAQCY